MSGVGAYEESVTIAATAGTITFSVNGIVSQVFVAPEGSVSAANAKVVQEFNGLDYEVVASEAVSTTLPHKLFSSDVDDGYLFCTAATPVKVIFDTATNDDVFVAYIMIVP